MLKALFISNYYPPSRYGGGYMQLCEEVVEGLVARGHEIAVLTSTYRQGDEYERIYPVHRLLPIDPDWRSSKPVAWQFFVGRKGRERRAVATLTQLIDDVKPDIVFVWHTIGLPREMFRVLENLPGIVPVYYFADYWPELSDEHCAYWQNPPVRWTARLFKRVLSPIALGMLRREGKPIHLKLERAICVSDYVRKRLVDGGLISPQAITVHNGIDIAVFSRDPGKEVFSSGRLKCLVAGRLIAQKGIHTVIEAFHILKSEDALGNLTLSILGKGDPHYVAQLRESVLAFSLDDVVEFLSPVPRQRMPEVLSDHDVLIASAEYDEPLARMGQEAMGCGLLVVGTTTGGSGEILTDGVNGLVFDAGSATSLAGQLRSLMEMSVERQRSLAEAGRETVVEAFDIRLTVSNIETYLLAQRRQRASVAGGGQGVEE